MMVLPIFLSRPAFVVGMPVLRAICCLAFVTPRARFHEKDNPGIDDFFAIIILIIKFIPTVRALKTMYFTEVTMS